MNEDWLWAKDMGPYQGWFFYDLVPKGQHGIGEIAPHCVRSNADLVPSTSLHDEFQALMASGFKTEWRVVAGPPPYDRGNYHWIIYRFVNPDDEVAFRLMWS